MLSAKACYLIHSLLVSSTCYHCFITHLQGYITLGIISQDDCKIEFLSDATGGACKIIRRGSRVPSAAILVLVAFTELRGRWKVDSTSGVEQSTWRFYVRARCAFARRRNRIYYPARRVHGGGRVCRELIEFVWTIIELDQLLLSGTLCPTCGRY